MDYQKKDKKLYICFIDMEKTFDRVSRKVMGWAMKKKDSAKVMGRAVRASASQSLDLGFIH